MTRLERYPEGWDGGPMSDQEKAYARKFSEWLSNQRKHAPSAKRHGLSDTNARMIRTEVAKITQRT